MDNSLKQWLPLKLFRIYNWLHVEPTHRLITADTGQLRATHDGGEDAKEKGLKEQKYHEDGGSCWGVRSALCWQKTHITNT